MHACKPLGTVLSVALPMVAISVGVIMNPSTLEAARAFDVCDVDDDRSAATDSKAQTITKRGQFEALARVSLSPRVEEKLNAIAERFQKRTGKTFVVTSGTRDPDNQAVLIYEKLENGEDLLKLYKDKSAVMELVRVFDDARQSRKSRASTVVMIASAIRVQMKRGIFISAHLKAGAADVRSSTMSPTERRTFVEIARDVGLAVMLEASPPHFHLQLD